MIIESLKTLLKIQELELILRESDIVHAQQSDSVNSSKDGITNEIENLKKEVPNKMLRQFETVRRNGIGIAAEQNGRCRACHMAIPVGSLNSMKSLKITPSCPNCGVLLYLESFMETK